MAVGERRRAGLSFLVSDLLASVELNAADLSELAPSLFLPPLAAVDSTS
jgi:hypothetical protein